MIGTQAWVNHRASHLPNLIHISNSIRSFALGSFRVNFDAWNWTGLRMALFLWLCRFFKWRTVCFHCGEHSYGAEAPGNTDLCHKGNVHCTWFDLPCPAERGDKRGVRANADLFSSLGKSLAVEQTVINYSQTAPIGHLPKMVTSPRRTLNHRPSQIQTMHCNLT